MELDTIEVVEGLIFVPEVLDEDFTPNGTELSWSKGEEQCPNCGFWNTRYLHMKGCYCGDCGILWKWNIVR